MTRRCSHCSNNGHNSRTCPNRGVKIFGVRLTDGSIRKSASMGNLTLYAGATGGASPAADGTPEHGGADGYASEDLGQGSNAAGRERKKGVPWTEEEHRMFLLGLKKLGKGDWRGIARNYVVSRTPTQVASHAQKYFIRQTNMSRRKRRTSLFDMVPDEPLDAQLFHVGSQDEIHDNALPAPPALEEECESMDSNSNDEGAAIPKPLETLPPAPSSYPVMYPTVVTPFYPFAFQFWPGYSAETSQPKPHEVVKPTAIHPTTPANVDALGSLSRLSLADSISDARPSFLSLKLPDGSDRHSAFHANPSASRVNSSSSAIPAV